MTESQKFLRAKEIAQIVGLSRSSVYQFTNKGLLPQPIKIGTASLWKKEDVDALVEKLSNGGKR